MSEADKPGTIDCPHCGGKVDLINYEFPEDVDSAVHGFLVDLKSTILEDIGQVTTEGGNSEDEEALVRAIDKVLAVL